jgi:hypothetical protein
MIDANDAFSVITLQDTPEPPSLFHRSNVVRRKGAARFWR